MVSLNSLIPIPPIGPNIIAAYLLEKQLLEKQIE